MIERGGPSQNGIVSGLAPYPAMRDSTVPWLGQIPEKWNVKRLKQVCTRSAVYGANIPAASYTAAGVRFLRTTDIRPDGSLKPGGVFVSHDDATGYLLSDGDLLISRSGTVGRTFLYDSAVHGACAYAGYLVRFVLGPSVLPRFMFYFTRSAAFGDFLSVAAIQATIENVNGDKYANSVLPIPSLEEQRAIIRFLDDAERRIGRYVRAKVALLSLLAEQKRVVVREAVTKGVDPSVPRKASGVAWLGDVPTTWKAGRIKTELYTLNSVRVPLSASERGKMTDRRYPYYGASGVIDMVDDYLFDQDSLLIAEDGANLVNRTLPLAVVARGKYWVNNHAHILRPRRGSLDYFAALLESIDFKPWISGAAQPKLTQDRLMAVPIPVPPIPEQQVIADWITTNTADIDEAMARARAEIRLLHEYKARLIADVTTGKLDVRRAVADLPASPPSDPQTDEPAHSSWQSSDLAELEEVEA
jgi:type I restriction enzyme, S subunit